MSKTNSQIITTFIETKQNMELDIDKHKYAQFEQIIKTRAKKVKTTQQKEKNDFNKSIQLAQKFKLMTDHKITLSQFEEKFKTNPKLGLSTQEAQSRLIRDGPNKLSQKSGTPWFILLLKQLLSPFSILLWGGAILCLIAYIIGNDPSNLYLSIIIMLIIIGTGTMAFFQNMKSKSMMDSFKQLVPSTTIVLRNGEQGKIDTSKLVIGDIVIIKMGDKIPADIRIIDSLGLKVDNSSLTGQTQLLDRTPNCTNDNPLETKNIAFFSTLAKQGTGRGIVFATGDNTFIGQIANLASTAGQLQQQTPLQQQIHRFIFYLFLFSLGIGSLLFGLGFAIGYPVILNFIFAIGVITANVPQGLILQITIGLTLTAKRLSQRKVLVKYLDAVQTLGATSCICSDKTGTLTTNKMTASNIWYSGKLFKAQNRQKKGSNYQYEYDINDPGFKSIQYVACICSDAKFDKNLPADKQNLIKNDKQLTQIEKQQKLNMLRLQWNQKLDTMLYLDMPTIGDASQSGLIKFFQPIQDIQTIRSKHPLVIDYQNNQCKIPFNSTNKYAYSINHYQTQNSFYCVFVKGAPQKIWKKCQYVDYGGKPVLITPQQTHKFQEANKIFGNNGERVLGFAKLILSKSQYPKNYKFDLTKDNLINKAGLCFVGVLSLSDPPRDTVPYAVLKCQSAGIKVIMVTGDQPVTATSIAKKCNIITEQTVNQISQRTGRSKEQCFSQSNAIVIHGDELTEMAIEDQGLPQSQQGKKLQKWLSKNQIVFARTSPAQKLIIVKACQKIGEVVAVTGDGVNDSPAIKKADIGISMGITGTQVAKDAADMILLNDDFSSIVIGIQQGRKIYDNIKKSICYALTSQIGQMLPFIAFIIFQIPSPVTTVIVLYISIATDLIPDIALAFEMGQLDLMTRKPRRKDQHMVTMSLMAQCYGYLGWTQFFGALFSFFVVFNDFGFPPGQLLMTANLNMIEHNIHDTFNPTHPTFGNTYLYDNYMANGAKWINRCPGSFDSKYTMVDWVYVQSANFDLRMSMLKCQLIQGKPVFFQIVKWGDCKVQQISPVTNKPVCYTTQACKYAQTSYFIGIIVCQIVNNFCCKTRKLSVLSQGSTNTFLHFAVTLEIMLVLLVTYFLPLNIAFGMRDNIWIHYGISALPFAIMIFIIDQIRKYFIRNLPNDQFGKSHWFVRASLW